MSGIPSLVGSLKKNRAVVEELISTNEKELAVILNEIDRLLQLAAQIQEIWEDKQAIEEELNREVAGLEGEIAAETRERSKLETTHTTQEKATAEAKEQHEKLKQAVSEADKKLDTLQDDARTTERRIRELELTLANVKKELEDFDTTQADSLSELQTQVEEAEEQAKMLEAKYKALRFLLKERIITMPEAKVVAELKEKETTTIDHLQKTTFIGRFRVKEILEELDKRGIIKFEKGSGQVKMLKPIDL